MYLSDVLSDNHHSDLINEDVDILIIILVIFIDNIAVFSLLKQV